MSDEGQTLERHRFMHKLRDEKALENFVDNVISFFPFKFAIKLGDFSCRTVLDTCDRISST